MKIKNKSLYSNLNGNRLCALDDFDHLINAIKALKDNFKITKYSSFYKDVNFAIENLAVSLELIASAGDNTGEVVSNVLKNRKLKKLINKETKDEY